MLCLVRDVFLCIAFHDHKREMLALNPVAGDSDRLNLRSFVCNFTSVRLPVLLQSPVNVDPPVVSLSPDLGPLPRMAHTFKFVHSMLLCLMLLDTRSRPSALVHSYMFVFTGTHVFSLARAHVFFLTCTGSFFLVRIDSHSLRVRSCSFALHVSFLLICVRSHLFAFIFSCMPSFSVYAFILSGTHSFSVGRTRSWLDTLVLGWTHSFLVVHTCSRLYALVLTCMHSSSPAYPYPLDDTEPQFTAVTTDSSKEVDLEGRGKRRRVANTQYKDFWQH